MTINGGRISKTSRGGANRGDNLGLNGKGRCWSRACGIARLGAARRRDHITGVCTPIGIIGIAVIALLAIVDDAVATARNETGVGNCPAFVGNETVARYFCRFEVAPRPRA